MTKANIGIAYFQTGQIRRVSWDFPCFKMASFKLVYDALGCEGAEGAQCCAQGVNDVGMSSIDIEVSMDIQ